MRLIICCVATIGLVLGFVWARRRWLKDTQEIERWMREVVVWNRIRRGTFVGTTSGRETIEVDKLPFATFGPCSYLIKTPDQTRRVEGVWLWSLPQRFYNRLLQKHLAGTLNPPTPPS